MHQTPGWMFDVVERPSRRVWVKAERGPPSAPTSFQSLRCLRVIERTVDWLEQFSVVLSRQGVAGMSEPGAGVGGGDRLDRHAYRLL